MKTIKNFLQINLHCSKAAQALMHQSVAEDCIDFVFAAEFNGLGGANWYSDDNNKAAIINASYSQLDDEGQSDAGYR